MKRKLIIFDLDDTLLNHEGKVSDFSKKVLSQVRDGGHLLAFNTARSKMRSADIFDAVRPDFAIYNGGAHITDSEGKTVYEAVIEKDECNKILREIAAVTDRYSVQNADWFYSANEDYEAPDVRYFDFKNCEFPTGAYKIIARSDEPQLLGVIAEKYGLDFITYFGGPFCRFTKKGVTKASGCRALADILGMDMDDVIAFGDDVGDLGMLYEAGLGVLMKNASPDVVGAVEKLTKMIVSKYTNDEDGVAMFLADYFRIKLDL